MRFENARLPHLTVSHVTWTRFSPRNKQAVDRSLEVYYPTPRPAMTNRKSALLDSGWQDVQRKTFTKW
jgi:hypothetical protein